MRALPRRLRRLAIAAERVCTCAHARVNRKQQFARPPVGAVNGEAPAEPVGLGADGGAVAGDQALIVVAPGLGAAGGDAAERLPAR